MAKALGPCSKCGLEKPVTEFPKVGRQCKACLYAKKAEWIAANAGRNSATTKAYNEKYRAANREKVSAYGKARRERNPDYLREWRARNGLGTGLPRAKADPEKRKRRQAEWREQHPARMQELRRNYDASHPERNSKKLQEYQAATLPGAKRYGHEWAGWELELASDYSRTSKELAVELGRTYAAIKNMRRLLKTDPKTIERAGLGDVL